MRPFATSSQLKSKARGQLLGHYLSLSAPVFMLALLQYMITVPSNLLALPQPFGVIAYYALDFALRLFFAILQLGMAYLFLCNACGQRAVPFGLFYGFGHNPLRAVAAWFVPALLLFLPALIPDFLMMQFLQTADKRWLLYAGLSLLPCLPLTVFIKILFSQVFYIMLDFPEMDALECCRHCVRLMKGNKGRYFYLMLSFVPLYLLGLLTCGIGLLYVVPYREQTFANFYLDLVSRRQEGTPA